MSYLLRLKSDLKNSGDDGEAEKERPAGLVPEDASHTQDLRQEDGDGDDQLIDSSDLEKKYDFT